MIRLVDSGEFSAYVTADNQRFITLGKREFAWTTAKSGDALISTHWPLKGLRRLGKGQFRLYEVHDEPGLTDGMHLELHSGERYWSGYLLPNDLPHHRLIRTPIKPISELISVPIN